MELHSKANMERITYATRPGRFSFTTASLMVIEKDSDTSNLMNQLHQCSVHKTTKLLFGNMTPCNCNGVCDMYNEYMHLKQRNGESVWMCQLCTNQSNITISSVLLVIAQGKQASSLVVVNKVVQTEKVHMQISKNISESGRLGILEQGVGTGNECRQNSAMPVLTGWPLFQIHNIAIAK